MARPMPVSPPGCRRRSRSSTSERRDATPQVRHLAASPDLAAALRSGDTAALRAVTARAAGEPGVVRVEILDNAGRMMAASGPPTPWHTRRVGLTEQARPVGALRLSTTTAQQYAATVHRLTGQQVVLRRGGATLASTVPPAVEDPAAGPDRRRDRGRRELQGARDHPRRARRIDPGHARPTEVRWVPRDRARRRFAILVLFLMLGVALAWSLARTLTRLHRRVAEQAVTDPLTGLWNRRHMAETLEREVARAPSLRPPDLADHHRRRRLQADQRPRGSPAGRHRARGGGRRRPRGHAVDRRSRPLRRGRARRDPGRDRPGGRADRR